MFNDIAPFRTDIELISLVELGLFGGPNVRCVFEWFSIIIDRLSVVGVDRLSVVGDVR